MKTVIIKWKQQYTDLLIERAVKEINAFKFRVDPSFFLLLDLSEPLNEDSLVMILRNGRLQASGQIKKTRLIKTENQIYTHRVFISLHLFNYRDCPYLSMDELSKTMPEYDWIGDTNFITSEEDGEILNDIWHIGGVNGHRIEWPFRPQTL